MNFPRFQVRWLEHYGLSHDEARLGAQEAARRAQRYPFPIPWVRRAALVLVEWCLPVLLLGRPCRASSLSSSDLERLETRLHRSPLLTLRLIYLLIRLPLWNQLYPDKKAQAKGPHPLARSITQPKKATGFDVLVIGSGAGGAPLAWQLSRAGKKVAVIESGPLVEPQTTHAVLERYYLQQAMTVSTQGSLIPVLAGNTVGGTTSINSGTCLRPSREKLLEWDRDYGTELADRLTPYFETVDRCLGTGIPDKSLLGPSAHLFEKGLSALGRLGAYVLPRSAPGCEGSGRCCFVCPTGAKKSTDLAFLPEAVQQGCVLMAETQALKIREDAGDVTVTVQGHGREFTLQGRRLILAGGAFGTPRLIRYNRLGSRWRHAGRHLRIHPASKVFAYFADPVHGETGVPQGLGYRDPDLPRVVFEGVFTPRSAAAPVISALGDRHRWWLDHYDHMASFGLMLSERTQGSVWNLGPWPVIRYRLEDGDFHDILSGLLLCAEVFLAAGAERILLPVVSATNEWSDLKSLRHLRPSDFRHKDLIASGFHPQGTAAIGTVVTPELQLMGTRHIYVCDASVLPNSPGVNPQITIMGLSLALADHLCRTS